MFEIKSTTHPLKGVGWSNQIGVGIDMKQIDILSFLSGMEEDATKNNKDTNKEQSGSIKELEQTLMPADPQNINIGELFVFMKKRYIFWGVKAENHTASKILAIRPKDLKKCNSETVKKYIQELSIKEKELVQLHIPLIVMPGHCTGYWLSFPKCDELIIGNEIEEKQTTVQPCWISRRKVKRISKEFGC